MLFVAHPLGPGPLVYAHRGARLVARENTIEAFRLAVEQGAHGIELDVWLTADGEAVVYHDARHPEAGWVRRCRWSDLRRHDAGIPTLAEAMAAIPAACFVDVELKNGPIGPAHDRSRNLAAAVVAVLAPHAARVVVSSFDAHMLERFTARLPAVPTAQLLTASDPDAAIAWAAKAGRSAVAVERSRIAADAPAVVTAAAGRGMAVIAWTVNDPDEVVAFAAAGVSVIVSDDPASAVEALSARR